MNNFEKSTQLPKAQIPTEQSIDNDELNEDELDVINGGCGRRRETVGETFRRWLRTDDGPNIARRIPWLR
jgi:hypothetical protein